MNTKIFALAEHLEPDENIRQFLEVRLPATHLI